MAIMAGSAFALPDVRIKKMGRVGWRVLVRPLPFVHLRDILLLSSEKKKIFLIVFDPF